MLEPYTAEDAIAIRDLVGEHCRFFEKFASGMRSRGYAEDHQLLCEARAAREVVFRLLAGAFCYAELKAVNDARADMGIEEMREWTRKVEKAKAMLPDGEFTS